MYPDKWEPLDVGERRSSIEIMTSIMQAARKQRRGEFQTDGGVPINKRGIMRSANINHSQLTKYLELLQSKGFVITSETDSGLNLEITDDGEKFLERTQELSKLLRD